MRAACAPAHFFEAVRRQPDNMPGAFGMSRFFFGGRLAFRRSGMYVSPSFDEVKKRPEENMDPFFENDIRISAGNAAGSEPGVVRFHE